MRLKRVVNANCLCWRKLIENFCISLNNLTLSYSKALKKPMYPVRPAQPGSHGGSGTLCLDRTCIISVFRFLSPAELATCALVCKTWAQYSVRVITYIIPYSDLLCCVFLLY